MLLKEAVRFVMVQHFLTLSYVRRILVDTCIIMKAKLPRWNPGV